MNKILIGVALAGSVMVGSWASAASAQTPDENYTTPPRLSVDAEAVPCSPGIDGSPEILYTLSSNVVLFPLVPGNGPVRIQFSTTSGQAVGAPVTVTAVSGTVGHPGNPLDFGWSFSPVTGVWERESGAPKLSVQVSAEIGGTTYESPRSVVRYNDIVDCSESAPPPPESGVTPPPQSGLTPPPASTQSSLPTTGIATLDTITRLGSLLLIAGLGTVIVSRRRRFSIAPPPGPKSAAG